MQTIQCLIEYVLKPALGTQKAFVRNNWDQGEGPQAAGGQRLARDTLRTPVDEARLDHNERRGTEAQRRRLDTLKAPVEVGLGQNDRSARS